MISGPELSRIVAEVENKLCDVSNSSSKRHEQVPHVQMIRWLGLRCQVHCIYIWRMGDLLATKVTCIMKLLNVWCQLSNYIKHILHFVGDKIVGNSNSVITGWIARNSFFSSIVTFKVNVLSHTLLKKRLSSLS